MSDTRILEIDPLLGMQQNFAYHHGDEAVTIETLQNVGGILDDAKREKALYDERTPWNKKDMGMNRVARIPMVIYFDLMKRGILNDQKALRKWLNDPANALFRTRPGRV